MDVSIIARRIQGAWRRWRHLAVGTDMLGATRRRPKHRSTAFQMMYGADVCRTAEPRLGLVDKAVMLRGREQCRPERGVIITAA